MFIKEKLHSHNPKGLEEKETKSLKIKLFNYRSEKDFKIDRWCFLQWLESSCNPLFCFVYSFILLQEDISFLLSLLSATVRWMWRVLKCSNQVTLIFVYSWHQSDALTAYQCQYNFFNCCFWEAFIHYV